MKSPYLIVLNVVILQGLYLLSKAEDENSITNPVALTSHGKVRGVKFKGHYEFRGIPFAKKPIGEYRFKV